jgi:hypothetical protein
MENRMRYILMLRAAAIGSALVALVLAACQAAPAGPTTAVSSPSVVSQPPAATGSPTSGAVSPSVSAAPLETCAAPAQDPRVWVVVHNNDPEEYVLEVAGRDGLCSWPIRTQANGGVTVPAAPTNAIRVRSGADCALIAQTDVGAGIYNITMQGGQAILRTIQETDALGLGEAPIAPCSPGG